MKTQTFNIKSEINPSDIPNTGNQVEVILYFLKQVLETFKTDVDSSHELIQLGAKTKLSQSIEDSIEDPLKNMLDAAKNFDEIIIDFLDKNVIKKFLTKRIDIIDSVHKLTPERQNLHYLIVLKQDNSESRDSVFDFFDKYDYLDVSKKYPVYFQFISKDFYPEIKDNSSAMQLQ